MAGLEPEASAQHRRFNYQICTALDMTKLGIVLESMVAAGRMHPTVAKTFKVQASALLAAIRTENSRAFGGEPHSPI